MDENHLKYEKHIRVLIDRTRGKTIGFAPPISFFTWENVEGLAMAIARHSLKTAEAMIENSPFILQRVGYEGLKIISEIGLKIAPHCWLTALSHFEKCPRLIDRLLVYGDEKFVIKVYHLLWPVFQDNWQIAVFIIDNSTEFIERIGYDGLEKITQYSRKIAKKNRLSALGMLEKCLRHIDEILHHGEANLVMDMFDAYAGTADHCWKTSLHLFEKSPELIEYLGYEGFCRITEKACELAEIKRERAISFIKGESLESADFMDAITENLKLKAVKPVLTHYLNALLSYRIEIAPSMDHSTDGSKIFSAGKHL